MAEPGNEKQPSRIHWDNADVESGVRPHPHLRRSNSNISINSAHSRRGSIDPSAVLPIQYRTVSFQIAQSKEKNEKNAAELQKAKNSAAKGMGFFFLFFLFWQKLDDTRY